MHSDQVAPINVTLFEMLYCSVKTLSRYLYQTFSDKQIPDSQGITVYMAVYTVKQLLEVLDHSQWDDVKKVVLCGRHELQHIMQSLKKAICASACT